MVDWGCQLGREGTASQTFCGTLHELVATLRISCLIVPSVRSKGVSVAFFYSTSGLLYYEIRTLVTVKCTLCSLRIARVFYHV
jgi:hypothetical protein